MGRSRDERRLPAPACRPDERDCLEADPAPGTPARQSVALMDLTPAQVARAHADEALAEECLRRARAAQDGLQHPNLDQTDREYLEGLVARFFALAARLKGS
jgi:hypothetical protein